MVEILVSNWDGLFSGAMLVSGSVFLQNVPAVNPNSKIRSFESQKKIQVITGLFDPLNFLVFGKIHQNISGT